MTLLLQHLMQKHFQVANCYFICANCCCLAANSFATPWTAAHQAPLSMGFSRQEDWSGLPFPPLGDLSDPGMEAESLVLPALAGGFFTTVQPMKLIHPAFLIAFLRFNCSSSYVHTALSFALKIC